MLHYARNMVSLQSSREYLCGLVSGIFGTRIYVYCSLSGKRKLVHKLKIDSSLEIVHASFDVVSIANMYKMAISDYELEDRYRQEDRMRRHAWLIEIFCPVLAVLLMAGIAAIAFAVTTEVIS